MPSLADLDLLNSSVPWFFPACVAIFGCLVGSFLNVCIYRIPAEKSVVRPGSTCKCGQPIRWYDNIPVVSWFILRGKARCCGQPYSFRYPAIEALTGALFLACWFAYPDAPAKAIVGMLLMSIFVCATFIDLDHMIIPKSSPWAARSSGSSSRRSCPRCTARSRPTCRSPPTSSRRSSGSKGC